MNINKDNYEAFFLDYYEGNLTPQEVADLLLFLQQHTELKEGFESFENIKLEDNSVVEFENKWNLKKEITIENKEEYFIKSIEGIITPIEQTLLNDFIKQHPLAQVELELFKKTKLNPDVSIVFENKTLLKKDLISAEFTLSPFEEIIVSSVEGLLSKAETGLFEKQLLADASLQKEYSLYQQTKLVADPTIVFKNKEKLKRSFIVLKEDDRKIIPFYYYVAAAATILLLFGLFFLFNNNHNEQKLAKNQVLPVIEQKINDPKISKISKEDVAIVNNTKEHTHKVIVKTVVKYSVSSKEEKASIAENKKEILPIIENSVALNEKEKLPETHAETTMPISTSIEVTSANTEQQTVKKEFLSIGELAVSKFKEKTLDKNVIESEKKSGRLKKINGWDLAQLAAKGFSKLTGKKVEVKPTYNEQGDVTAYALDAGGFQISRGR